MRNIRSKRDVFNGILVFVYKYTLRITGNRRRATARGAPDHSEVSNVSIVHPYDPGRGPAGRGAAGDPAPAGADELAAIDPNARTGAAGWRVDGITGEASAHRDAGAAAPLAVGQVLSVGSEVATGAGAVVFLSHNGDRLIIQPNSRLRIDEPGTAGLLDHFMQSLGSVFYDVEPRKNRSFGVTAPYVAAVIKGTRFLVTVGPDKNSVRVDRGRVLVEFDGRRLVGPGRRRNDRDRRAGAGARRDPVGQRHSGRCADPGDGSSGSGGVAGLDRGGAIAPPPRSMASPTPWAARSTP